MKYFIRTISIIGLLTVLQSVYAGSITDTYTTGDKLTATKLNNIKSAINDNDIRTTDNDVRITAEEGGNTAQDARIASEEAENILQDTRITANEKTPRLPDVTINSLGTRIIAGCINYTNTVPVDQVNQPDCGGGFTWKRLPNNYIQVTFNSTFGINQPRPVVTATANILAGIYITIGDSNQSSATPFPSFVGFVARVIDTDTNGDSVTAIAPFSFIAIGSEGLVL